MSRNSFPVGAWMLATLSSLLLVVFGTVHAWHQYQVSNRPLVGPTWQSAHDILPPSCAQEPWPQAIPTTVVGKHFTDAVIYDLQCFRIPAALADGDEHNVFGDPVQDWLSWTVVGSSPEPGTVVNYGTPVTLHLRRSG